MVPFVAKFVGRGAMTLPKTLVEGYRRFVHDRHAPERGRYIQLAELGQAPAAMVIACCDARIDVSAIFDVEAGELFILRNIANLVPNYEPDGKHHGTSAAIEFAVQDLKVPHLIVLGHSHCGGIEAYRQKVRNKVPERGFLGSWLTLLDGLKIVESEGSSMATRLPSSLPGSGRRWRSCATSPSCASGRRPACSRCTACISIWGAGD